MYLEPFTLSTLFTIILAALASVIVSALWYHPLMFGGAWMRRSGISPELAERTKRFRLLYSVAGFAASVIAAYVLYCFGAFLGVFDWVSALQLSFWCWLGFAAPTMFGSALWQQRSMLVIAIDISYWLAALCVMSLILLL